jgi:hypothetical protein
LPSLAEEEPEARIAGRSLRGPNVRPLADRPSAEFDRRAAELQARGPQTCELILARLGQRHPDSQAASPVGDQTAEFLRPSLEAELRAFAREELPDDAPEVDAEAARALAGAHQLSSLLNVYRATQGVLWETWFGLVEDSELEASERRTLLSRGSEFFFAYADLLSDFAVGAYEAELQRSAPGGGEGRRLGAIRSVLEGNSPDPTSNALEYDLDQHHLGILALGERGDDAVRQLAARLERPYLLAGPVHGTWWAWVSGVRPFELDEERSVEAFDPPPDTVVAVGQPAFGEDGFRATHRQAQRAHWTSRFADQSLVRYMDVAATSLASENSEEAEVLVARELRGIEDDSAASQRIRDTLLAYFESEHNAASAAARLGVHQQTIANRLRAVEERLGRSVGARRLELELALRLRAALAGERV